MPARFAQQAESLPLTNIRNSHTRRNFMHDPFRKALAVLATAALGLLPASPALADGSRTATPIKHLVVL